jgi:puromycin-sensitive aminopeptidase
MKKVKRLYDQFKPQHYVLEIQPDKEKMVFSGNVIISGQKTDRPSRRLTFHQKGLKVTKTHVVYHSKKGDETIEVDRINHHSSFDEVRLHTEKIIYPGKYTITLTFTGEITRAMNGMYPCFFTDNSVEKKLIATQFESHHAREVFPCIDEPEAKATFDLSLVSPKDETVLANTPIKSQKSVKNQPEMILTTFERTPHMSTYLLAFAYGELDYLEAKTADGVTVRTYATKNNVAFTKFALVVAVKCLDFYNEYFDIPYPLDKCDMLALPDFASGAMENWGLITYREQALLVDPDNTSLSTKQYVAMVVAHELTHQWFGNLVTMKWWTDLWLNEGFATWFEYLAVDHLFPEWKMWTQFAVDEQQQALKLDALEHTHPVEVEVHHPDEIRTIFDTISYSKGASVIHMLYHYLGAKDFQTGLRYYLKKHSYKNTLTSDLWEALQEASEKPVSKFMDAWTSQSGYPIVSITVNAKSVTMSQEQFILNPKASKDDSITWPVPLLTNIENLPDAFSQRTLKIDGDSFDSLQLNVGGSGFYRTTYNASHLQLLAKQISLGHMEPLDRLGILADITEAAKSGKSDAIEALSLLKYYKNEQDNAVWDIIAGLLGSIRSVMDDDQVRKDMKPFTRELVANELKRLGWEPKKNESHFDRLLRPTILGMASVSEVPEVVQKSTEMFADLAKHFGDHSDKSKQSKIDPDLRSVIYGTIARNGGQKEFDQLLLMHNATTFSEERLNLCAALCSFKQPELIEKALSLIDSDDVRLQDVAYWLVYSFSNRYAKNQTWEWMIKHWDWLDKNMGNDLSFYRLPIYAARGFSDESFLVQYKEFFGSVLSPAFERSYNQGTEMIQWQSAWKKRDLKLVKAFFKK